MPALFISWIAQPLRLQRLIRRLQPLATALLIALAAGCTGTPERAGPDDPMAALDREALEAARQLAAEGDWRGAARAYEALAAESEPPLRQQLLLDAAGLYLDGGQREAAQGLVSAVEPADLPSARRTQWQVLRAQIALLEGDAQAALEQLPPNAPSLPGPIQERLLETAARAYQAVGDRLASLERWVALDALIDNPARQRANRDRIWALASSLPASALSQRLARPQDAVLAGWLELALILNEEQQRPGATQRLASRLDGWELQYPGHPATEGVAADLRAGVAGGLAWPAKVALLLPVSGPLAEAGAAVRDGFLAAYYEHMARQSQGIEVSIYDVGGEPANVAAQYDNALADGAGLVIGPLQKSSVEALLGGATLPVTTLALNAVERRPLPSNLFLFGLLPEDEALQVAETALARGHERALVLAPANAWGDRLVGAFRSRFGTLDGVIVDERRYAPDGADFSSDIETLFQVRPFDPDALPGPELGTDEGLEAEGLDTDGDRPTDLDPQTPGPAQADRDGLVHRQDADFVFLVANPRQGRLLMPQMDFFGVLDIPVYSTSHIFGGRVVPSEDRDLNELAFFAMPWTLVPQRFPEHVALTEAWPDRLEDGRLRRLFALGADAFELIPILRELPSDPDLGHGARVGRVYMSDDGRIARRLMMARFEQGRPVVVDELGGPGAEGGPRVFRIEPR